MVTWLPPGLSGHENGGVEDERVPTLAQVVSLSEAGGTEPTMV